MNKPEEVKKFIAELSHPLKNEVEEVCKIIRNAGPDLDEQIKWNAPSFSYKGEYIVTLNIFGAKDKIRLIFHHPKTPEVKSDIFDRDHKDYRRIVVIINMQDLKRKEVEIERIVRELMARG